MVVAARRLQAGLGPKLRQQASQDRRVRVQRRGGELAQRFDERLVGDERLGMAAPEQHLAAVGVRLGGDLGREAGLPDPGLAREQRHPRTAGARTRPGPPQALDLAPARHERPLRGPPERARERALAGWGLDDPRRGIPGQQPVVQRDQRGGRGRPELVAQQGA